MSIKEVFSIVAKDWQLIESTRLNKIAESVERELEQVGWKKQRVKRFNAYASFYIVEESIEYEVSEYVKIGARQGDNIWYKDLADIMMNGHRPGILTKILG